MVTTVLASVERDLAEIAKRDPRLAESTWAAIAVAMAREMDASGNSATSKSMCAARLQDAMTRLDELAPAETEGDALEAIRQRGSKRLRSVG